MPGRWSAARAAYAVALRAFPRRHRARYGEEMLDAFEQELQQRRSRSGAAAAAGFAAHACMDAVVAGLAERRRRRALVGRSGGPLQGTKHDVVHAVRALSRSWTFTFVCLFSLAIGVGITMALVLLLRITMEPPFDLDQAGLVEVVTTGRGGVGTRWAYPDLVEVAVALGDARWSAWADGQGTLRFGNEEAGRRVDMAYVSADYFGVLGVGMSLGRPLGPGDDEATGAVPAVVRHSFWKSELGADPAVIGREVWVNREPYRIVGVAAETFPGHGTRTRSEVWVPLSRHPDLAVGAPGRTARDARWLRLIARLPDDMAIEQAEARVAATVASLGRVHPGAEEEEERTGALLPYQWQGADVAGGDGLVVRTLFYGAAGILLLVVCLNLSGMVVVRTAMRERELAVRTALGAGRWRMVRFLMAESVVLAVPGGLLVATAYVVAVRGLAWHLDFPVPPSMAIDASFVGICMALALGATLVFGLLPALRFSHPVLLTVIKDDVGGGGRRAGRIHRLAIALQTALAVPALVVAGGITEGALSMGRAEFGFPREDLYVATPMDLAGNGYDPAETVAWARAVKERLVNLPGVAAAGVGDGTPLDATARHRSVSTEDGTTGRFSLRVVRIGDGYLGALNVPILRGRGIGAEDGPGAAPVAVITAALAERLFAGQDPLGRPLTVASPAGSVQSADTLFTVVGVTGDMAGRGLDSSPEQVFLSLWQNPTTELAAVVRATDARREFIASIQEAMLEVDPWVGRPDVQPFQSLVDQQAGDFALWSVFFGVIAALLLLLSAMGVYGVVAFAVANRTREIGVRMSLGATRPRVLGDVLRDGARLAAPGMVLGAVAGIALARLLLDRMFATIRLPMADTRIIVLAAMTALGVVLLASLSPARRAAAVDPMRAMRAQ